MIDILQSVMIGFVAMTVLRQGSAQRRFNDNQLKINEMLAERVDIARKRCDLRNGRQ